MDSASRPSRFIIDIPFAPTMADFFLRAARNAGIP
jgi:hypothetical protein